MSEKIPTSVEFLERLRVKLGEPGKPVSDYAVAKALGVTQQTVSKVRQVSTTWGHPTIEKIAELLEVPATWAVACIDAERARNVGLRRLRIEMVKKMASAVVMGAFILSFPIHRAEAAILARAQATVGAVSAAGNRFIHYAHSVARAACILLGGLNNNKDNHSWQPGLVVAL